MNIKIMSRVEFEKLLNTSFPEETVVISFSDTLGTSIDFHDFSARLFTVVLDDLEYDELEEQGLDLETYFPEADELAQFVCEAVVNKREIICQCEYGQGRSAGCAAAILEAMCGRGIEVFSDYRYYPNKIIYNKLVKSIKTCMAKIK